MSMLDTYREQRSAAAAALSDLIAGEASEESFAAVEAREAEIADLDGKISTLESAESRKAAIAETKVEAGVGFAQVTEQRTYNAHSKSSFVRDLVFAQTRNDASAWERLNRHMHEESIESRDIGRADGAIGEFVVPTYLLNAYAGALRPGRTTADRLTGQTLPTLTDQINIPRITTGTKSGWQNGDNTATTTQDMVTTYATGEVRTLSGYTNLSIQLLEQSAVSNGIDAVVFADLLRDMDYQINAAVISGVGTAGQMQGVLGVGTAITYTSGTPTGAGLHAAIGQAISKVSEARFDDVEAVVMRPSHWYWLSSQTDSAGRPLVVPTAQAFNPIATQDAPVAKGMVGHIHGVPVYLDSAIPNNLGAGTNESRILVGRFSDSWLYSGGIKTRVLPDVLSSQLSVRLQAYQYTALVHRYPASLAFVSGTGVVAPSGF